MIRRLDGQLHGDYRTLFRGFGLDLADLREYQYHDDVRYIDWNVTARLMTPYVRVYNEDREVTAWFLLDLSPSVDFGSQVKKRSVATEFVTVLARLLSRHGNRVGALFYGDKVDMVIPPRSGRRHGLHDVALAELGKGKSQNERKKNVVTAVRLVAAELGNTPTICRKSYVHPVVVTRYLRSGTTITLPDHAHSSKLNGTGHAPEESALIGFLDEYFPERRKAPRDD